MVKKMREKDHSTALNRGLKGEIADWEKKKKSLTQDFKIVRFLSQRPEKNLTAKRTLPFVVLALETLSNGFPVSTLTSSRAGVICSREKTVIALFFYILSRPLISSPPHPPQHCSQSPGTPPIPPSLPPPDTHSSLTSNQHQVSSHPHQNSELFPTCTQSAVVN